MRPAILFAVGLALLPLCTLAQDAPLAKPAFFKGKVVAEGNPKDPQGMKLVGDDGKVYPLARDAGSHMFFLDPQLLNRPMRLTARLMADKKTLQVVNVHSYLKGKLHDVYYWCDICAIRGYQKGICDCCGDPMEFRETPAKE